MPYSENIKKKRLLSIQRASRRRHKKALEQQEIEQRKFEKKLKARKKIIADNLQKGLRRCYNCKRWKPLDEYTREVWARYNYDRLSVYDFGEFTVVNLQNNYIYYEPCKSCLKKEEDERLREIKRKEQNEIKQKKWKILQSKYLTNWYIRERLKQERVPALVIDEYPELLELKRLEIKTIRLIKNKKQ